ncbi:MAG TPA: phosphoribosylamine--glycine ligase [Steroidobacteraceae bacterium]|nr:phosphoribosylamine--glycine ligase [Steroidobacteraceae bacterium]
MKILIVGSGGREHALAWKCAASPRVSEVLVAPGNAGTAREARVRNVEWSIEDLSGLAARAASEAVALTIVGPEAPLVAGIVDEFQARGLRCLGPSRAAAQLEGSKAFTKQFLQRHAIPTAGFATFTRADFDAQYVRAQRLPIVVKASGLAAGKGVVILESHEAALAAIEAMFAGQFGAAGAQVVVEEFLPGEEASFIVLADGRNALPLATSQDHKRRDDGDRGPNTGGMGAYSPAPIVTPEVHARVMREVISPTLEGLAAEGTPFTGFLYAGLMIAPDGTPNVVEFNCRLGDPEAQPLLARLNSDLTVLCDAALAGRISDVAAEWDARAALGVVLAAAGYPESSRRGDRITGLERAAQLPGKVFHSATLLKHGEVYTNGGRVLTVVGLGTSVAGAQREAYALVEAIHWQGMHYRRDIGHRAIARERGRS